MYVSALDDDIEDVIIIIVSFVTLLEGQVLLNARFFCIEPRNLTVDGYSTDG